MLAVSALTTCGAAREISTRGEGGHVTLSHPSLGRCQREHAEQGFGLRAKPCRVDADEARDETETKPPLGRGECGSMVSGWSAGR
jgi:hypothetical protein